jgi:hypothetical protein
MSGCSMAHLPRKVSRPAGRLRLRGVRTAQADFPAPDDYDRPVTHHAVTEVGR